MKFFLSYGFIFLFFSSCASYINKLHRQIQYSEQQNRRAHTRPTEEDKPYNPFARKRYDKRPINNPVTFQNSRARAQSEQNNSHRSQSHRRYQANDLVDHGHSGSLWAGEDKENFLFAANKTKALGDIIIIDVLEDLKNDIANELKRAFPVAEKKKPKTEGKTPAGAQAAAPEPPEPAKADNPNDTKIYDKISSQVVEIISKDYVLIRGEKEVLFRKKKRIIDVQALISKKDLSNNDRVDSDKILEQKITVLR